jgi:hypothetical protein
MRKYNILSDLVMVRSIQPIVYKQYDNGDNLEVELYEDGAKINLSTEIVLAFFELPDGTVVQKTCSIQNGNAIATLDNNILSQSGNLKVEFTVYKNGNETTTRAIFITVEESINRNEAITTTPQWDIVQEVMELEPRISTAELQRQTQESQRQTNTTNAINRLDTSLNSLKLEYKSPVANFAALATTYPTPTVGWIAQTLDNGKFYRFNGSEWLFHSEMNNNILTDIQNRLSDANRQSQVLTHGTQILNASQNSPVDLEIQGRTLTSLGNSNLEANKSYVLADKRTKIRSEGREGTLISGVAKFTKSASLITKADFVGKVSGSVVENPHVAKAKSATSLLNPSDTFTESTPSDYPKIASLNGTVNNNSASLNGQYMLHLFSFNIIEQIERKLGRIPSDTVAGKVQWIKDNVQRLTANWHGWGSSVGGNGATVAVWNNTSWATWNSHANGVVTKIAVSTTNMIYIDSTGFMHLLAHTTNPSDGTTPSQLNTDFVELEIELKPTAVLDTRPIITRTATFDGKVSGSTVENPNIAKRTATGTTQTTLSIPNVTSMTEFTQLNHESGTSKIDGITATTTTGISGAISQHLFSFNLIEEVERNIGRIPKATVVDKVQWLKDNLDKLQADWYGFGSSVGGSKASLTQWRPWVSSWESAPKTHSNNTVSSLSIDAKYSTSTIGNLIDTTGMIHYLAYAEPSDGATASTINTDYIELQITLKQGATLYDPVLPLYEVDATDYAKILVDWNEAEVINRYPKVQGVQHLQNLAVIAEGENLLPPFTEGWLLHTSAIIKSAYSMTIQGANGSNLLNTFTVDVIPNTNYVFSTVLGAGARSRIDGNMTSTIVSASATNPKTFNSGTNTKITIVLDKTGTVTDPVSFDNPILTPGNVAKPFVPRNPSYLFAPVKLGQIGTVKDSLILQGGEKLLVERVKKDVVLDGGLGWTYHSDYAGFKRVNGPTFLDAIGDTYPNSQKYNGLLMRRIGAMSDGADIAYLVAKMLTLTISDIDTGFGETYSPLATELSAYFNGWQAKTVDGNGKPTSWRSLGDGTDAPTQTLAYVSANKAANFTPYKLSYVLAAPQTLNVNHLVEGDIAVSGPTQVEVTSGVVVREKVTPALYSGTYFINDINLGSAYLKNKSEKILNVYANGQIEKGWSLVASNAVGKQKATLPSDRFNPTAEYTVTYLVLDRHLQTVNALEVKASYSGSLKDTVDMNSDKLSDVATQTSINTNLIYRLLVQAKANNWSV